MFRFALAWTNDWTAAEDLAQEAYLRLWDHRGRLDWGRPVLPWLLVTTRRLATDRFRALRRRLSPSTPTGSVRYRRPGALARCLRGDGDALPARANRARHDRRRGRHVRGSGRGAGHERRGTARGGQSRPNEVGGRLMETPRVDRILEDWVAVASQARRPSAPPRRVVVRTGLSGGMLAGASLMVAALVVAAVLFGQPGPPGLDGGVGGISPAPPSAIATPDPTPTPSATPSRRRARARRATPDTDCDTDPGSHDRPVRSGRPPGPDHPLGGRSGPPHRTRRPGQRRSGRLHDPGDGQATARGRSRRDPHRRCRTASLARPSRSTRAHS